MQMPATRYARSGELSIAYQVVGDGDLDVVFVPGYVSHVELLWEPNPQRPLVQGVSRFARVIVFDKRGTGLSDRHLGAGALEERMDDVRAVMDAVGIESAVLLGVSEGGPMSLLFSATYPERVRSVVLYGSFARAVTGPDYPHGVPPEVARSFIDGIAPLWGTGRVLGAATADIDDDPELLAAAARYERNASTPGVAAAIMRANAEIDVRHVLPAVTAPTLIVHCSGDPFVPVGHAHYLAEHVAGASYVELDDDFHASMDAGRNQPIVDAIEEFLTGTVRPQEPDRVLKTILFTDIVDSTKTAGTLGDARWRKVLDAHDHVVRAQLQRFRGTEISTTGDGFLAAFDGPARAIRCAHAIIDEVATTGVRVRAGLHAGECELRGDDLAGMTVHIGARVAALAGVDEVVVSSTVRDLVAGSGLEFEDRGEHDLKGVPGRWRLLRALPG